MVRRSFRIGLRVGILLGLAVAAAKMIQSRRSQGESPPDPWTPVQPEPERAAEAARPKVADAPSPPVGPTTAPGSATVTAPSSSSGSERPLDEVGEPIDGPSPEPTPAKASDAAMTPGAGSDHTTGAPAKSAAKKTTKKAAKTAKKAGKAAKRSAKRSAASGAGDRAWVEPSDDTCPPSHPLKAKLSSKIFHRPGGLNYDRTSPDRCYADEAEAVADGLRAAKR